MPAHQPIEVVAYDPVWPELFLEITAVVWPAVAEVAVRLDHIGSTAVPGLAAKPIIDLDIVVATAAEQREIPPRLAAIGYEALGDLGIPGRDAFAPLRVRPLPEHHLYSVVKNNRAHMDHWLLRDYLRSSAAARARYAAAKRDNARKAQGNLEVYTARKAALVAEFLTAARKERGFPPEQYWVPSPDELLPPTS